MLLSDEKFCRSLLYSRDVHIKSAFSCSVPTTVSAPCRSLGNGPGVACEYLYPFRKVSFRWNAFINRLRIPQQIAAASRRPRARAQTNFSAVLGSSQLPASLGLAGISYVIDRSAADRAVRAPTSRRESPSLGFLQPAVSACPALISSSISSVCKKGDTRVGILCGLFSHENTRERERARKRRFVRSGGGREAPHETSFLALRRCSRDDGHARTWTCVTSFLCSWCHATLVRTLLITCSIPASYFTLLPRSRRSCGRKKETGARDTRRYAIRDSFFFASTHGRTSARARGTLGFRTVTVSLFTIKFHRSRNFLTQSRSSLWRMSLAMARNVTVRLTFALQA